MRVDAPQVLKTTQRDRSSAKQNAITVVNEFDQAYRVQQNDFDRMYRAWRRYFPVRYGKWEAAALKEMTDNYRQPVQFDIVSGKIETLAGSMINDLPDPSWVPVHGQSGIMTDAIAETYFTDKSLYHYDNTFLDVFLDGLVHSGDMAIFEDYRFHTPRVAFERVMPGYLVWDPYWLTDDDRDAEVCFRVSWMNAERIKRVYDFKTDEIEAAIERFDKDQSNYPYQAAELQKRNRIHSMVGDEYEVIEKHYLKHIKTTRLIGRKRGESTWIPFPIDKERAYYERFAEINDIDWTTVVEDTYEDRIHYVTTVCRELDDIEIVTGEKSKIQVNGLPFYHFSASRHDGENMGLVERMADVEDTINKRESLVTELLSKANGGSTLVDEDLFHTPEQRQDWVKNKNKPGHAEFVDLKSSKTPFIHMAANQYPSAVIDQINRMFDRYLPLISRVSDAMSQVTESKDTGILFDRKYQANLVANTVMVRRQIQFIQNLAEGYFYQWQLTYKDYEQQVIFRDQKTKLTLNKHENGLVLNAVDQVERCRVVISQNKKSPTFMTRWRGIWAEVLPTIDKQLAPSLYIMALGNFIKTLELTEEDKAEADSLIEMLSMATRMDTVSKVAAMQTATGNSTLQGMQIEMQIKQFMAQMEAAKSQVGAPAQHGMPQPATQPIQYPQENQGGGGNAPSPGSVNPQPTEAAPNAPATPPA